MSDLADPDLSLPEFRAAFGILSILPNQRNPIVEALVGKSIVSILPVPRDSRRFEVWTILTASGLKRAIR